MKEQGVARTGRNTTGPPRVRELRCICAALQTTDDRRQTPTYTNDRY